MSSLRNLYRNQVLTSLRSELKAMGFTSSGRVFRRSVGEVIHFIGLESWPNFGPDAYRFTLEIAIHAEALVEHSPRYFFGEVECGSAPLNIRVGWLSDHQCDHWWTVTSAAECDKAIKEVADVLRVWVLPYLDAIVSKSDLARVLRNRIIGFGWPAHITSWAADILDGQDAPPMPPIPQNLGA
ncbi:MAG TPA: DUF4304 domain-containing protein [Fimbriimonadaceae bacterium]|nr:DUF4304 domain-containing protein [Fimbriimonadaceae bacterium]HRJ96071.1 DUF4304 domain-containing protein [Fimbriimonadaceae bacterium]